MRFREFVSDHARPLSLDAGQYVFRQGDTDRSLYMLKTGLLKAYYLSSNGKENIKSFIGAGDLIGSLKGVYGEAGCSFSLVCLTACDLVAIDFDKVHQASQTDLQLASDVNRFLIDFAMKKEGREFELLCLSAEERYQRLLDGAPHLLDSVTQNDIARYLGVTPVGLSRIKKRVERARAEGEV